VNQHRWLGTAILLAACGGGTAPVQPSNSAATAVQGFMQAVADSNLAKMADLWGTARGPASKTRHPPDYERRVAVMQAYLRNDSFRLASDVAEAANRRAIQVVIRRQTCTWAIPFIVIRASDGSWLVNQVDIAAAGNPARPCVEGETGDTASRG
jgi:hypothetical protein